MARPANVMTTAPSDSYGDLSYSELQALAKERGIPANLNRADMEQALREHDEANRPMTDDAVSYAPGEDLEATEKFVAPGQPPHRYDANARPPELSDPSITFLSREHLLRMSRGEIVDIAGKRVAAGPEFPPYHQLTR